MCYWHSCDKTELDSVYYSKKKWLFCWHKNDGNWKYHVQRVHCTRLASFTLHWIFIDRRQILSLDFDSFFQLHEMNVQCISKENSINHFIRAFIRSLRNLLVSNLSQSQLLTRLTLVSVDRCNQIINFGNANVSRSNWYVRIDRQLEYPPQSM